MVARLAVMIAAAEHLPAHQVALVPARLIYDRIIGWASTFFPFAFGPSERGEWTAQPIARVPSACAQGGARAITENVFTIRRRATLPVLCTRYTARGRATSAGTHKHDLAWWARARVAGHRASVRASDQRLHAH